MDSTKFDKAKALYDAGDFRAAASGFLDAVDPGSPVGNGPAYHLGGNALLKIKRYADAIKLFEMALADDAYGRRSALQLNIAAAHLHAGDYSDAVRHYEAALDEPDCGPQYRVYNGMGKALMKQQRFEEAAVAYRRATLDGENPDPGRSLVELGVCLAAVGKPEDAIAAYRGALSLDTFANRALALVNLGFAYHALHEWADSVRSFEEARDRYGATLSASAQSALDQARTMVAPAEDLSGSTVGDSQMNPTVGGTAFADDVQPTTLIVAESEPDEDETATPGSGLEVVEFSGAVAPRSAEPVAAAEQPSMTGAMPAIPENAVSDYFQMSEKEAAKRGRDMARASKGKFAWVRTLVGVTVVVGLIVASLAGAWYTGFGVPSATDAVSNLMEAYNTGKPMVNLWVGGATNITREMAQIPALADYTVGDVAISGLTGDVSTTITPTDGDPIEFVFEVSREGFGWKVSGVEPQY